MLFLFFLVFFFFFFDGMTACRTAERLAEEGIYEWRGVNAEELCNDGLNAGVNICGFCN